ncbi:gluconate 2-dehydrogenase subunit 3 family protein [Dyadobacter fanqingshengii]|uniref:Gluconate 2-dehydrogenase subunit 3 family protein n=1 Tax=Dyadobacter fanqingshengii TaxID=2906443 RepID=A0A9X1PAW8_9BACT|nr:gluconate 2-dehydrogenase subunit 3 family protein [Dyadobacter fanqingshengii]MCF0041799.1 gluconate 2-dehydrogenase subunit 3 family protein [Dyadobacter fanqingshengii]MCF2504975.1 gluconate 2-dehydrogenase subunit 3 family protein [Dyadobacter fanqingshengii]USJ36490.1 gluconate 2-dehydrogenase subunit 3 family protein [Dyadobacter fanqingshengii]
MKRRDTLKALTLSSLGLTALNPQVAMAEQRELETQMPPETPIKIPGGRTKEEAIRDAKLMKEKFLTVAELATIKVLVDIIIPADDKSGSASQAGVPDFIEFIAKDMPQNQVPLRGGLKWLELESNKRFTKGFALLTKAQQLQIVDDIAYPEKAKPIHSQGVAFFNLMRNLTASGYYTSKIGIADLGYMGNTPNVWEGVPADVLKQYGLSYE